MKQEFDISNDWAASWNGSIAIKVTAVTIWIILVLSFVLTIPFVSSFEDSTLREYSWQRLQVEELIHRHAAEEKTRDELANDLAPMLKETDIRYLSLNYFGQELSFGLPGDDNYSISTYINDVSQGYAINAIFEFPSLRRSILLARVEVGSAIVGFSVLFGIFLFWINKHIVHTPFRAIVELTQKISAGEKHHRLDVSRTDEFGVLAKFMNAMLDALQANEAALKDANAELVAEIKNREEALAASQQKSAFLANMSHEIRTPLSSIIGYSERIRFNKVKTREEEQQMLDVVLQNGNHLLHLINDILDLSKVEANKLEVETTSFSIVRVVEHTCRLLSDRALEQGSELLTEYEFPVPANIHSDPIRTKQILLNLISNAIRFTHNGTITVSLSYDMQNDDLMMTVKDTGIGMTEAELEGLFMPFAQADVFISRKYGGTGLGLTISKRLAELMGGDITVQSIKGLGSSFCCRIKAGCDIDSDEFISRSDQLDSGRPEYEQPVGDLALQGRILLVEDTPEIQALVKACLEDYGIEIDTADNGQEGLQKALANESQYDLVLMDVQMPVMNGKQATRQLRASNFSQPILALTADALTQHAEEFIQAGFTEVLTKPIVINDLVSSIQSYLAADDRAIVDDTIDARSEHEESEDAGFRALQEKFLDQLPGYVEQLSQALEVHDTEGAQAVLHKLKGMGGSFGYPDITRLAIEMAESLKTDDSQAVDQKLQQIRAFVPSGQSRRSA